MSSLIHLRLEEGLKKEIQNVVDEGLYSTQSEFIKESIRGRIKEFYREKAIKRLSEIKGKGTNNLTKKERSEVVKKGLNSGRDIFKELGLE